MGGNIEVKDVQRTEYLDKNGLDMLWAKVKENTRNQVEEEYNRAQAVEGDITNKLDNLKYIPYVSKNNMNSTELGDFVKYLLGATEFIISAQHGSNDARTEFRFGEVNFISRSKDSAVSIDYEGVTAGLDNNIKLTNTGIRKYINRTTPAGSATEAFSTDGGVIDTTAFALKSELDSYAKKTDIPEVDTSDFVSKTATDSQIINSSLGIIGGVIQIVDYTADEDQVSLELASTGLEFNGSDRSTIELNASDVNSNKRSSRIIIEAFNENPEITLQGTIGSDYAFQNNLTITNEGISSTDNSANHVYATDGSIADLTEYIKIASNITTKGFGSIKTVDAINNNIGVGDNTSSLAYIGKGELGAIKYNEDGYATESFRYTSSYGLETTNTLGYKNVKIPCDQNYVWVYKSNSNDYYTKYGYSGVQLGENNDDSNLLNTNGSYKTIGTDITPLENGKVPAEYLDLSQYAKKSEIADKVDTTALTALEEKVTANTTAIEGKQDAGNYIPYNMLAFKNKYVIEPSYSIEFRTDALNNKYGKAFIGPQIISITSASGQNAAVEPEEISIKQSGNASGRIHSTLNVDSFGVYNNSDDSVIFKLNQYGIKLEDGDDNHVLTSNASTIDIREYVLKSVYDKKIASLEARIAALEAKHAETA